jgi:hypothetical protein
MVVGYYNIYIFSIEEYIRVSGVCRVQYLHRRHGYSLFSAYFPLIFLLFTLVFLLAVVRRAVYRNGQGGHHRRPRNGNVVAMYGYRLLIIHDFFFCSIEEYFKFSRMSRVSRVSARMGCDVRILMYD